MKWLVLAAMLSVVPAYAADKALILTDKEQTELVQALDAATKAQGLVIAPATLRLYYKLQSAGSVIEKKDDPQGGAPTHAPTAQ